MRKHHEFHTRNQRRESGEAAPVVVVIVVVVVPLTVRPDGLVRISNLPPAGATMTSLSNLMCHNSLIVKRTGLMKSKYEINSPISGDVLFQFQKNGKTSGRGRQLLLQDMDQNSLLMMQITELSELYSLGVGSAQMTVHTLPGGRHVANIVMVPGFVRVGNFHIRDASGCCLMTFQKKNNLFSFCYKFKNTAGVPIGKISSMESWSSSRVKVDFHPGIDNETRIQILAAAFLITKVETQSGRL